MCLSFNKSLNTADAAILVIQNKMLDCNKLTLMKTHFGLCNICQCVHECMSNVCSINHSRHCITNVDITKFCKKMYETLTNMEGSLCDKILNSCIQIVKDKDIFCILLVRLSSFSKYKLVTNTCWYMYSIDLDKSLLGCAR